MQALVLAQPLPAELAAALVAESRRLMDHPGRRGRRRAPAARWRISPPPLPANTGDLPGGGPGRGPGILAEGGGLPSSARALVYFKNQGLILEEAAMGVLIQRLVQARAAGATLKDQLIRSG